MSLRQNKHQQNTHRKTLMIFLRDYQSNVRGYHSPNATYLPKRNQALLRGEILTIIVPSESLNKAFIFPTVHKTSPKAGYCDPLLGPFILGKMVLQAARECSSLIPYHTRDWYMKTYTCDSSCWLNQPVWKICASQIGSFPQISGWIWQIIKYLRPPTRIDFYGKCN